MDKETTNRISQDIEKLVKNYADLKKTKNDKEMAAISEANVRADYVDRLFGILGWDIGNPDEYDREHFIRGAGFADVALKLNNKPVIFVEAKRFGGISHSKDIKGDWTLEERQSILYALSKSCKWAILTNFEKFRVFNVLTGLTILNFESIFDYKDRFSDLLYLTKDAVESGRIEKLGVREEKPDIDLEFLEVLNKWRRELANDIYVNNFLNEGKPPDLSKLFPEYKRYEKDPKMAKFFESRREILRKRLDFSVLKDEKGTFDIEKLKSAVQRILDRLIIIRWAEDRLLLDDPNILDGKLKLWKAAARYNPLYEALFGDGALFDKFNDIHNGEIFRRGLFYDRITVSDDVLARIIEEMTSHSFRKFDFDILGNTYETYLGNTLYLKDDNTFDLKPSQETRKESGIYYTPPYVVDYIVKNTLGALLSDKKPEEVARIKVLDPACGSGSFLIKAYDCFANFYEEKNRAIKARIDEHVRKGMLFETSESTYSGYEASILMNNIHGVDLDAQAAEIAAVNLMLKALKPNEMLPPILGETIKVGNSLISGGEEELQKYFGEEWHGKKPFNWEEEFADVFDKALADGQRGFDVVIGNPPWVSFGLRGVGRLEKELDDFVREKYPNSAEYKLSVYGIFTNRAIDLMADKATFGFIVPDSFLLGRYFSKLRRYILDKARIIEILMIVEDFWPHGNVGRSVIILLQKEKDDTVRKNNEVVVRLCDTLKDLSRKNFKTYSYKQDYFETILYNRFRLFFDKPSKDFVDKREKDAIYLKEIVSIHTGVRSKIGQKNIIDKEKKGETWNKGLISGSEIGKYRLKWDGYFINIEPSILWSGGWDPEVVLKDKLIMRQTGDSIYATFDAEKYYHLNNCHSISLRNPSYNLKYILAILNSKLMNHYYHLISLELGRAMAQTDIETIELLPIKPATLEVQQEFVILVDSMLDLNKQLSEIRADFQHYLDLRPHSMGPLRNFMDALPVGDKEVLKHHSGKSISTIEAEKFEAFDILEEGEWLFFVVGYIYMSAKDKPLSSSNVRSLRLRIQDNSMRKFVLYSLKDMAPGKLGSGNIIEQLQKLKIPRLVTNGEENRRAIEELMAPFLAEVAKKDALEREIREINDAIDKKVYTLYGLTDDEIKILNR